MYYKSAMCNVILQCYAVLCVEGLRNGLFTT